MPKPKVLFICVHNSARSQMAEAYLRQMAGDRFQVASAGLDPGPLNPLVVEVMREDGIDLSGKQAQSVFDLYRQGRLYDYVITVCQDSREKECPLFPGVTQRLHWGFPDPAALAGTPEEKLQGVRRIRDQIKRTITDWVKDDGAEKKD